MALKDLIHILRCVVFFALLPNMVHALSSYNASFSLWIILFLGVLGGIAVIVVFVIEVYFCCNKCSLNPTPGIVVTVNGADTRAIVTSGMWKKYGTKAKPNLYMFDECFSKSRNRLEKETRYKNIIPSNNIHTSDKEDVQHGVPEPSFTYTHSPPPRQSDRVPSDQTREEYIIN